LHNNIKLDFAVFRIQQLKASEIELLRRDCEIQRTQIYTILMLAMINDRSTCFLLTGNRSNFLETVEGGSTAWLYNCKRKLSQLRITENCYRIPIDEIGALRYVDPISRPTFNDADIIPCGKSLQNLFHMDLQKDDWYTLEPEPRFMQNRNNFDEIK